MGGDEDDGIAFGRTDNEQPPSECNALDTNEIHTVREIVEKYKDLVGELQGHLKNNTDADPYMDKSVNFPVTATLETVHVLLHLLHYTRDTESCSRLLVIAKPKFDTRHYEHHSHCGTAKRMLCSERFNSGSCVRDAACQPESQ